MELNMCELLFVCITCVCIGALSGALFGLLNVVHRHPTKKDKKVDKVSQSQIGNVSVIVHYED